MFKLERVIFYAAFVVRKLIENGKITDKVARQVVEVAAFKANDAYRLSLSGSFTAVFDEDEYALDQPEKLTLIPTDLASEIIHSHKLVWSFGENGYVEGIFLSSYRNDRKRYWTFIQGEGRRRLRGLYCALHAEHPGPLAFMKSLYASEIADRIVHDRQLCAFIAKLLLQIGFDGDVDGLARQWVERCNWPVAIKRIIAARDRGKCADCGIDIMHELEADAHFDHIVPISRGGCNDVVNLQLLCASRNRAKRAELRSVRSSVPRYVKRRPKGASGA